jgi:hypothetical protein
VAAVLLAALLLPAAASAREPTLPVLDGGRGWVAVFWNFLDRLFLKIASDNHWTIDPNGAPTCPTSDNGWQIDPNG